MIRRLPKRGFNNAMHTVRYAPVNVSDLNTFEDGAQIDGAALRKAGLANGTLKRIKILGKGDLKKKLTILVDACSASARAKIEKLGGTCEIVVPKEPKSDKA